LAGLTIQRSCKGVEDYLEKRLDIEDATSRTTSQYLLFLVLVQEAQPCNSNSHRASPQRMDRAGQAGACGVQAVRTPEMPAASLVNPTSINTASSTAVWPPTPPTRTHGHYCPLIMAASS